LILAGISIFAGTSSAIFLRALDLCWQAFSGHPLLALSLPLAGALSSWLYLRFGGLAGQGNNLLLEEIQHPSRPIPLVMAPMVFVCTLMTHIAGGSAGREGTAVQMSGAMADALARRFRLDPFERTLAIRAGIAAGFAALFGTPLAGCLFAIEVVVTGSLAVNAFVPTLICAIIADRVALVCGAHHTSYKVAQLPHLQASNVAWVVTAAICFGLMARFYNRSSHACARVSKRLVKDPIRRIAIGGAVVATALLAIPGALRYAGLGVPLMQASFIEHLPWWDAPAKAVFTALTLGFGFKGGEVTPLFCVGSTLGNALSAILPLPMSFLAGLGFVAVFGACANVPLAAAVMAMELFGPSIGGWALLACITAFSFSGQPGIYSSQGRRFDKF
jgi:H+/Cl- antiporter ClcA